MLEIMLAKSRLRACLPVAAAAALLAGCGVPPLHRSVVVETNSNGVPVHASGTMEGKRYTVVRGDTLYSIAFRANVDYHQLARWNGIRAPYVIHPGQVLRLTRPAGMPEGKPQVPVFEPVPSPTHTVAATTGRATGAATAAAGTAAGAAAKAATPAVPVSTVVAVAGKVPTTTADTDANATPSAPIPAGATRRAGGVTWRWPATGKVLSGFQPAAAIPGIDIGGNAGDPVRAAADGVVVYSGDGLVGYGELVIIKHNDDYLSAYGHNSKRLVKEGEHVQAGQVIARMGSTGASRNELEFQVRYKGKPVDPLDYLPRR